MTRHTVCILVCLGVSTCIIPAPQSAAEVIGTNRGKVYHNRPGQCKQAQRILVENRIEFASEDEARQAGRRLCRFCQAAAKRQAPPESKPPRDERKTRRGGRLPEANQPPAPPPTPGRPDEPIPEIARVTKILSGGTIVLDNGEKVAFIGVVMPNRTQRGAKDAVRFIKEQTRGRNVRITTRMADPGERSRDELGRLLVYIRPVDGGRNLGGELIFQGYGWTDRTARFRQKADYLRNEQEAWRRASGIWQRDEASGGQIEVVSGRHADHFHAPRCSHVRHLTNIFALTLNEAKARRLVPCSEVRDPPPSRPQAKKKRQKNKNREDAASCADLDRVMLDDG